LWLDVLNLKETTENYFLPFLQPWCTLWLAVEVNLKENTKFDFVPFVQPWRTLWFRAGLA